MRNTHHKIQILILICSLIIGAVPLFAGAKVQVSGGRPIVDGVYVNGHGPYKFLVDTGTNVNLIDANLARSIGLIATFRTKLTSSTGVTLASGGDGIEVLLDSAKAGAQEFLFLPPEAIREHWPDIQGVLGQSFLSRFDYTLDLRGKRLEFGKQERDGTRTRFEMINDEPVVSTSLGKLVLDSGASQLVLFGVQPDIGYGLKGELRTPTGSQQIGLVSGKPLIIEGQKISRGDTVAIPNRTPGVDGLLPLSLFKAIYFCNSQGYVVFE
jgi:hypothetical protein